jgi:NCAIR mutase (PurE)-related protein
LPAKAPGASPFAGQKDGCRKRRQATMDEKELTRLLEQVREGSCDIAAAVRHMKHWPAEAMEFACLDHHRSLRTGFPEVVYGADKSAAQVTAIMEAMLARPAVVMATRIDPDKGAFVQERLAGLEYLETARMLVGNMDRVPEYVSRGTVLVLSAGTSDIAVAEEAFHAVRCLGSPVEKLYDVGVAGIHRLLSQGELLHEAAVLIVVAGMEGALPSVVAGLVQRPVIAVPTSVGYGASFGGITALLGMLNSCAPGVAVVNIDNGFGAAYMGVAINRL